MKKISVCFMLLAVVLMAGCGKKDNSEERKLPTLAPEVTDLVQKGEGALSDAFSSLASYVDEAKKNADELKVEDLKTMLAIVCGELEVEGANLPGLPIRFRYTKDLALLDGAYSILREKILEVVGEDALELSTEGSYLMVEIFIDENGSLKADVTMELE